MARFFNFSGDYYGLTESNIEKNTELYGYNIYTKSEKKAEAFSPVKVILSPSFLLMFIAGVLSLFGSNIASGILILLIDAAYAFSEIYFGTVSDKKLSDIKESTAMRFRVIRSGKLELIEKEFIVPEDIIVVQSGERVPADAFIQEARDLSADESIFTGSNKPVMKFTGAESKTELSGSFVYSGTTILTGMAICKVSATGVDTKYYQKIGEKTDNHHYYTRMERAVRDIVPFASAIAAVITLISLICWLLGGNTVVDSALRGITLGLCFIPTGISSVIRFYYVKGATDMISRSAVVKSLCDVESLNSVSVLCIEKQGAISKNHLEVRSVYTKSEELLYKVAMLACDKNTTDEAERALMVKAGFFDENISEIYNDNTFLEKIPENNGVVSGSLWQVGESKLYCVKGTPEQILPLCKFKGDQLFNVQKKQHEYYAAGYRVMAIACADAAERDCDATAGFAYTFVGFVAFSAPLRDAVTGSVKSCGMSGVKVVMLAEDSPHVAEATAKMVGLSGKTITGKQISDSVKYGSEMTFDADIYAKVTPEQKLYILDNLKKQGEVVAMTGTRTTDAEALELADVGITIAQHTAGSAYEASDIIMNDDNLASIANMITSARQIHRNIKRGVSVMISGYAALLVLMILNLFGDDTRLMLNAPLIALLTMIFIPLAALAYVGNKNDMNGEMPPSNYVAQRRINYFFILNALIIGLLCGAVSIASYMFMYNGANTDFARSCSLISFCVSFGLFGLMGISFKTPIKSIISARDKTLWCYLAVMLVPLLLIYIPFINSAFGLTAIDGLAMFISIITGIIPIIGYAIVKYLIKFK
ncbi:MAG: cation-transporting P-type ATPase [Ruminococcaceae bacterium]|nr:cation-transporting P-type ATPase [Oscillospiraceae bacterium]